jgi:hypothetical protein
MDASNLARKETPVFHEVPLQSRGKRQHDFVRRIEAEWHSLTA